MAAPTYGTPAHDDVLKDFQKDFDLAEKAAAPYQRLWSHLSTVYKGDNHAPLIDDPDRSQFYRKVAYKVIETKLPRLVKTDPQFDFIPIGIGMQDMAAQADQNAKVSKALLQYQFGRDRFTLKQPALVKPGLIYGLMVAKVTQRKEVEVRRVPRKIDPMQVEQLVLAHSQGQITDEEFGQATSPYEDRPITIWNQPTVTPVDVFDFFWDPSATSMDDARVVYHRSWMTTDQLKAKAKTLGADGQPLYSNISDLSAAKSNGMSDMTRPGETSEVQRARRQGKIEVIECWWRDRLLVIANRDTVIRDGDNPYDHRQLPFVVAFLNYDIGSFVGLSDVWSIDKHQDAVWTIENQRIDAVTLTLDPVFLVRTGAKDKTFVFRRGARIEVDDPSDIQQLSVQALGNPAAWEEVNAYMADVADTTGINTLSGNVDTSVATVAAIANKEAGARIDLQISYVEEFNAQIAKLAHMLNQQFQTAEQVIPVVGPAGRTWMTVTPEAIAGEFDIRDVSTSEAKNNQMMKESVEGLLSVLGPMAPVPGQPESGYHTPDGMVLNLQPLINKRIAAENIDPDLLWAPAPQAPPPPPEQKQEVSESMAYKDAPPDIKRQMEAREGYVPSQVPEPVQPDPSQQAPQGPPPSQGPPNGQ